MFRLITSFACFHVIYKRTFACDELSVGVKMEILLCKSQQSSQSWLVWFLWFWIPIVHKEIKHSILNATLSCVPHYQVSTRKSVYPWQLESLQGMLWNGNEKSEEKNERVSYHLEFWEVGLSYDALPFHFPERNRQLTWLSTPGQSDWVLWALPRTWNLSIYVKMYLRWKDSKQGYFIMTSSSSPVYIGAAYIPMWIFSHEKPVFYFAPLGFSHNSQ